MAKPSKKAGSKKTKSKPMLFSGFNYKILSIGLLLVAVGFTSMYLENEVKGFISLFISPILIMSGYVVVIFSILKHEAPKQSQQSQ